MKKTYYLSAIILLATIAILPVAVRAEDDTTALDASATSNAAITTTPVNLSSTTNSDIRPIPRPAPRPGTPSPELLREQMRAKAENVQENIKNNAESRNKLLENRKLSSTTPPKPGEKVRAVASSTRAERKDIRDDRREEVGDIRQEGREDMRNASTSQERREIRKDMRIDIFKIRKEALLKQLGISLENLKQIRERISTRIEKATAAGRDMTKAKSLLITADTKIQTAINAIEAVKSYVPPVITATSTTSTDNSSVDLTKPRQVGEVAIKAIKDANQALVAVVRAIAHAMGLGNNASTTPPVTATTTP